MVTKKVVFLKSFMDALNAQKEDVEQKVESPVEESVDVVEPITPEPEAEKTVKKKKTKKSV